MMNLLFAINRDFANLLCTCLLSIVKNGGALDYEAYILHSDLEEDDQNRIVSEFPDQVSFHFIRVDETAFEGFPESNRYPKQIYYRLAAPLLLPDNLDRILYLDVDLVVINPLEEVYHMDFEGNFYIACSHVKSFLTKFNQIRLGVDGDVPYINTGVMLMNLESLRRELTLEQIRRTAEKMHTFMLPDQDLLTVMYGDRIKLTDTMRYNLSDRMISFYNADPRHEKLDLDWVRKNGVIIHYYGKNRPWNDKYSGILDVFYHEITGTKEY